jgi:hypothetical protein
LAKKTRALDDQQKESLDAAFMAQLDEDLVELERLTDLLPRNERPGPFPGKPQLAKLVAARLNQEEHGVLNRLYGNGVPKSFAPRERFMKGVESILRELYEQVGVSFSRDYQMFVNPVDGDEDRNDDGVSDSGPLGTFAQWSQVRIGGWLADAPDPPHLDTVHHYLEIFRQDMLDYGTGDFYSIRRLRGRNISRRKSSFVLYRESSERKFTFSQAQVRALDVPSKEPLSLEPELGFDRPAHTHAFRIHLRKPIEPGDTFDVVYNIRCPGELLDLNRTSEVMTISLTRAKNGVDKLIFNVALSFQPRAAVAYRLTQAKQFVLCEGTPPSVGLYKPRHWFEHPDQLGIEWTVETPYIIRWSTANPRGRMYIINFRGDPATSASHGNE